MVNYLCRHGVLEPTLSTARRRGLVRRFSYADLLLGRAVATLLSAGVSVIALRRALVTLRRKLTAVPLELFRSRSIAIVGNGVYVSEPGKPLMNLSANGQLAFHFVLDAGELPITHGADVDAQASSTVESTVTAAFPSTVASGVTLRGQRRKIG
jgi:hypothetical protein